MDPLIYGAITRKPGMLPMATTALATTVVAVLTSLGAIALLEEWPTVQASLEAIVATVGVAVAL